jgi:2-polyprenyl-3-methyl-5-hydroxy-6-metoxy-1,4-benzoquinol methylase
MYQFHRIRNVARGLAQRFGPEMLKQLMWNAEYLHGRWNSLDNTKGDCVYPCIEKHSHNGKILDLGCGSGNTANELSADSYCSYVGVDIAEVAINKAIERTKVSDRAHKVRYVQSDVMTYKPEHQFDVILFRESIYYVPWSRIESVLKRYSSFLSERGVMIVRLFNCRGKHAKILDVIESNFDIVEKALFNGAVTAVIVFRPIGGRDHSQASVLD